MGDCDGLITERTLWPFLASKEVPVDSVCMANAQPAENYLLLSIPAIPVYSCENSTVNYVLTVRPSRGERETHHPLRHRTPPPPWDAHKTGIASWVEISRQQWKSPRAPR